MHGLGHALDFGENWVSAEILRASQTLAFGVEAQREAINREILDGSFDGMSHLRSSPVYKAMKSGALPTIRTPGQQARDRMARAGTFERPPQEESLSLG